MSICTGRTTKVFPLGRRVHCTGRGWSLALQCPRRRAADIHVQCTRLPSGKTFVVRPLLTSDRTFKYRVFKDIKYKTFV